MFWNAKNKAVLRDVLKFRSWQHQKRSNSARLPSRMQRWVQSWRPRTNVFCDFSTPSEVLHLSHKIILPNLKIWCSKMQPLSGDQRPYLLTSLMNMSLVLRLPREIHVCRSSSNVPCLPSFLEMLQKPYVLLTFEEVHNPFRLPRKKTSERPKVLRTRQFFPTSLCGVHVFRLDPASSRSRRSHQIAPHSTHHSSQSQLHFSPSTHHSSTHHSSQSQLHSSQLPRLNSSQLYFSPSTHHSSSRGRRSTQSLLDELRRAWPPLGRGCLSCGRRSTQSLLDVCRSWAAAAFRVVGAVHRASWSNCGALGRRWAAASFHTTHHSFTYHITTSHHNLSQLITTSHIPTHHSSTSHTSPITAPLLITTHHSSTSHRSTSHHFSQVHFSSHLITTYHIPTHHTSTSHTSLITSQLLITTHHHLSHPNSSQLHFSHHFSHLTYRIRTHHSSTSHTWHHKSTSHTSLLTPPRSSH